MDRQDYGIEIELLWTRRRPTAARLFLEMLTRAISPFRSDLGLLCDGGLNRSVQGLPSVSSSTRPAHQAFYEATARPRPNWNVGMAGPAVSDPTVSDVPVLIMKGSFDAATAPEWVDRITPGLKNSQLVAFPFTGHSVLGKSQCAPSIMTDFLDNPTEPVDAACAAQIALTFVY